MSRRRILVIVAFIILAVFAAVAAVSLTRGSGPNTATVSRGTLEATIQTTGQLSARNPIVVRSNASGTVQTVAVQPGDAVNPGDVLVQLDRTPFDAAIQHAQQQLANAEEAVNLAQQNAGDNPTPQQTAQVLQASQNLDAARQQLQNAQDQLSQSLILAPAAGTVIDVQTAAEAPVGQGSTVVDMANLSDLTLSTDIDEIDFPHVSNGMATTFRLDAYPGNEINGTITSISPVAKTTGGTTTFPATISFTTPKDLVLRPGMNANVSIKTAVRKDVLLIPDAALRTVGNRTFVTVVRNGKQTEQEIQIGLRSNGQVEVASGLNQGEKVVLH